MTIATSISAALRAIPSSRTRVPSSCMAANVLIGNGRRRTCKELTDWTNRPVHVLTEGLGVKPGNRVLMRPATAQCVALAASIPTQIFMILPPQYFDPASPVTPTLPSMAIAGTE